ncbi:hypothetical protein CH262_12520 [Rhodococcus sp. 05-2255-1e]|uniref:phage upper tail fiber protein n=1 Tax=Rhodococcus sp. 05-2255-1e TaxID=2022495 RepID=UPI000B9AF9C6|nr:hypothetical protein [Rhodococcus sp. 05-2255-1e]OZE25674.1 hypothetical protein CH262_12520 [Rhodococcus sp. 05-2255-1e]
MTLKDDINNLPVQPEEGQAGHRNNHKVVHAALKDHELRLTAEEARTYTWTDVANKPTTFAPAAHNHAISDVTNLQATLDSKAAASHGHSIANITNLQTTLDSKAGLVGGVIPTSLLPRVNIGETYTAANSTARLALDAQPGDVAIQSDNETLWMLKKSPASAASSWMDLTAIGASAGVISVNGQTGTVVLAAADVSAAPTSRTIAAGTGLSGGGDLTANRTVSLNSTSQASLVKADSAVQGFVNGTSTGTKIERMTAAQYAALATKDSNTIYVVTA